jgi:hypothetical protein
MKKMVWVAAALLVFALFFPNGVSLPSFSSASNNDVVAVAVTPDAAVVKLLRPASRAEKNRVVSVYAGLKTVLARDNGKRINTTEKWEEVQAQTLQMAIDEPGKYEGLDEAIEAVFAAAVKDNNTDPTVVNPVTPEMQAKLIKACDILIASAK